MRESLNSSQRFTVFLNNFLDTDKAAVPVFVLCAIIVSLRMNNHLLAANPKGGIERLST